LRSLLLAIRFLLELAMLAALAYWGFDNEANLGLRILAGLGAPAIAIGVWGRWVAPKSSHQLDDPARFTVELILFAAASFALVSAGLTVLGVVLTSVYLLDRLALTATGGTGL
jgi:hypothetical protein